MSIDTLPEIVGAVVGATALLPVVTNLYKSRSVRRRVRKEVLRDGLQTDPQAMYSYLRQDLEWITRRAKIRPILGSLSKVFTIPGYRMALKAEENRYQYYHGSNLPF